MQAGRNLFHVFLMDIKFHSMQCQSVVTNILKKTFDAKSEFVLLESTPHLCLRFVFYDMRLVNTSIIAMYDIMNYSLLIPNLVAFNAKLNEIQKTEFHFALVVSFSILLI